MTKLMKRLNKEFLGELLERLVGVGLLAHELFSDYTGEAPKAFAAELEAFVGSHINGKGLAPETALLAQLSVLVRTLGGLYEACPEPVSIGDKPVLSEEQAQACAEYLKKAKDAVDKLVGKKKKGKDHG